MKEKLCSICKKRPAVYYRAYSGEYICAKCLNNVVEKSVKREISRTKILSIDSKILVPIVHFSPSSSLALFNILSRIEKRFKSKIAVVIPKQFYIDQIKKVLENSNEVFIAKISPEPPESLSLMECIRYERAWATRAAKILGYNFIALPITRSDISLMLADSFLNGEKDFISETLDYLEYDNIRAFYPFSNMEGELLSSYEFISGNLIDPKCLTYIRSKHVFYSIAGSRPELDFGSVRIMEKASNALMKFGEKRCKICGGFSDNETCNVCKKLNLENLDVELSIA